MKTDSLKRAPRPQTYAECTHTGEWRDGQANGRGTFRNARGTVYEGEWANDMKSGHGIMQYAV